MRELPRGIAPDLLISQVKNTMPYLFGSELQSPGDFPGIAIVLSAQGKTKFSHLEYFSLCLASHYLTCGTPVPTDVDNQIRKNLWPAALPPEDAFSMASLVLESRNWNFCEVSGRSIQGTGPLSHLVLDGHYGEWFTVACAAYCALKRYPEPQAQTLRQALFDAICEQVVRHSEIFGALWRNFDGLACLKASTAIAHNFGDLDRVMDFWELGYEDPLRLNFYQLATKPFDPEGRLRFQGRLWVAGELYKSPIEGSSMALENHRHFALRKPKCLRKSPKLLTPIGPFFDDWGKKVARVLAPTSLTDPHQDELQDAVAALVHGAGRLPKTQAYLRALRSIQESHPDISIPQTLANHPTLKLSQHKFETLWSQAAIQIMDEIPSRA